VNGDGPRQARPTRVLHLIQNLNYGGMERVLADLVNRLEPARFESHVMPLQYAGRFAADIAPTATLHDPPGQERTSLLWPRRLARAVRAVDPDVVHTHSGVWYKGARAARMARVPRVVHTEHGRHVPDPAIARFLDRAASRRTDVVVAVSEDLARTLVEGVGVSAAIVRVVPNGVAPRRRRVGGAERPLRERLAVGRAAPIIASVGRLEPVKGYDVLLDAFARIPRAAARDGREDDGPILVVAGDGSMRSGLEARARELGILHAVRLPGWVDDVAEILEEADVFVLSSRSEGTSISLLEAMAAGVCPVVTDVGGNAAVLGPDLRHRLVPPGDASALAHALSRALADHGARRADATAAQARAADRYDLDRMAAGYAAVYEGGKR
jgi:glycosyltransferase involved in cell wall biosynthesis